MPYFVSLGSIGDSLIIPDWGAGLAAVTFLYAFLLYLWPPIKVLFAASFSVYSLLAASTGALIVATGGAYSAFISLWILVAVFAAVFGLLGIGIIILSSGSYIAYLIVMSSTPPVGAIAIIAASTVVPAIASFIIFHTKSSKGTIEASAYNDLANELSHANSQADIVIQAIDDGVISINPKGNIQLINPSAQRILGWGNNDALGLKYESVLKLTNEQQQKPDDTANPVAMALATNKEAESKELYATTGGGKRILLAIVVSPIGQMGQGAIIVFRDITKEHAEEREKAEFISTASHEMRTPVASIEGYLGLALNPATAQIDDKARDFIEKAHASAKHLGRLFQDLLDVSKAEDGRLSNHPKIVDVVDYVGEVVEGLQTKAADKKLRLFYKPKPDGDQGPGSRTIAPVLYSNVDNDHLREVVANLVENAIKYTPEGDVIVDVTANDETITISIQDSGIGIAKEDIAHLFQKFYRIDSSDTREIGGTGLGLYLCRRLSEIMGGRIYVESELKKGSTFFLEIPRTERGEAMRLLEAQENEITVEAAHGDFLSPEASPTEIDAPITTLSPQPVSPSPTALPPAAPVAPPPTTVQVAPSAAASPSQPAPTLAAIEQNPTQYTHVPRQTTTVKIPVRNVEPTGATIPPKS